MTLRVRIQQQACFREACFSSILSFRVPFMSALNIHRAQHPSRTPPLQRKNGKYGVAPPDGHLRQSAQSLRSSSGYDRRITSWSESSPVASGQLDKQEILTQLPLGELQTNKERQGNLLQEYEQRFKKLSEDQKLSRLCSEAGFRLVEIEQFFCALPSPRGKENQS